MTLRREEIAANEVRVVGDDHQAAIAFHPEYLWYDFGPEHPMRPERLTAGLDLLETLGVWRRESETIVPTPAGADELELIHDATYIRMIEEAGSGWLPQSDMLRYGLAPGDNPAFAGMHEASAAIAGGSIEAARWIMRGKVRHAFNPAGGLHHALRARASGFCIYNDPALAAAVVLNEFGGKTLYIDLDCHHGDGVQEIFYDEPGVMTVSFHETGRFLFPGTGDVMEMGEGRGHGYSINVPVAPFTDDTSWLEAVHAILPPLTERFRPDIIISSLGADTHVWDPLTHVALTTASFFEQARLVHDLAHTYTEGRWLALGSGGYDWRRVVPRSWAILWAEMTGRDLSDELPAAWRDRWEMDPFEPLPVRFRDEPGISPDVPTREHVERLNRTTIQAVQRAHGLRPRAKSRGLSHPV